MELATLFTILCFGFTVSFYIPYIISIYAGKTRPTLSSWISWGLMDVVIILGMFAKGQFSWQVAAYIAGNIVIMTICLRRHAQMAWTRMDSFCVGATILAAALWKLSGDSNIAIMVSLIAMAIGTIPTYHSAWKDPTHESLLAWILCTIGGAFGVIAIRTWDISTALAPSTFFTLQLILLAILSRQIFAKKN